MLLVCITSKTRETKRKKEQLSVTLSKESANKLVLEATSGHDLFLSDVKLPIMQNTLQILPQIK